MEIGCRYKTGRVCVVGGGRRKSGAVLLVSLHWDAADARFVEKRKLGWGGGDPSRPVNKNASFFQGRRRASSRSFGKKEKQQT